MSGDTIAICSHLLTSSFSAPLHLPFAILTTPTTGKGRPRSTSQRHNPARLRPPRRQRRPSRGHGGRGNGRGGGRAHRRGTPAAGDGRRRTGTAGPLGTGARGFDRQAQGVLRVVLLRILCICMCRVRVCCVVSCLYRLQVLCWVCSLRVYLCLQSFWLRACGFSASFGSVDCANWLLAKYVPQSPWLTCVSYVDWLGLGDWICVRYSWGFLSRSPSCWHTHHRRLYVVGNILDSLDEHLL